jgi:RNA polymerase sigma factor (sigma-70 family)
MEITPDRISESRPESRPAAFLSSRNPEACRMTETAHEPESDDFYDVFIAPAESRMLRAVWRIVRNPDLAQDTVQDALAAIWRCREKIRLHPNPQALMLKIATDVSYDALRRSLRLQRREQAGPEVDAAVACHALPAIQSETDPLEEGIRAAIARLPRKQALAVLMRLVHEQTYPSVARALGCSEPTARIHVMRGRAQLRRLLSRLGVRVHVRRGAKQ